MARLIRSVRRFLRRALFRHRILRLRPLIPRKLHTEAGDRQPTLRGIDMANHPVKAS